MTLERESRRDRIVQAMQGRPAKWLAEAVGCAPSTAHSYVKGAPPPADVAVKVADVLGIDLRWYVTGEGAPSVAPRSGADLVEVPLLGTDLVQCGTVPYPRQLLEGLSADPAKVQCIFPGGVAMRPTVPDGAEVLFVPVPAAGMSDGRVYVLSAGSQAIVRRARLSPAGQWTAVCDNPAFRKEEAVQLFPRSAIGEVIWVSHRP